jgi:CDP-diacylglycerol--serine O-phosphatidyltransferase
LGALIDQSVVPVSPAIAPRGIPVTSGGSRLDEAETPTPTTIPLLPGDRTPVRRLKFAVANGATVSSLLLGMVAIFLAVNGELRLAALAILACVIFDGLDGGLARKFGVASPFGAQMDLAD